MRRPFAGFAVLIALCLALAPAVADARAGLGGSFGSRGSRTYSAPPATGTSPYGAAPFSHSTTVPGSNSYGGSTYGGGGFGGFRRPGFGSGLAGGLLGFGLGSMLFGHHAYGYGGYGGFGGGIGLLGLLIRLAIIVFVVRWLFRMFARRAANGGGGGWFSSGAATAPMGYAMPVATPMLAPPLAVQTADYQAFEVLLKNVQAAWSNNDLNALRDFATPEMVSTFADQLAGNASRGARNTVTDVQLQKGDLSEAWSENGRDYATVAMRYSMIDATYDRANHLIDGSATEHTTVTEYWTFVRVPGGRWMLSGIQQGR